MGHQVQVHVKGCDWTIVNPNNNNKKEAHIAFTLEVETLAGSFSTCGTKKIVTVSFGGEMYIHMYIYVYIKRMQVDSKKVTLF